MNEDVQSHVQFELWYCAIILEKGVYTKANFVREEQPGTC